MTGRVGFVFLGLALLALLPVASVHMPAIVDYPNHLARMAILAGDLGRFYVIRWNLVPNLAMDLIVPPLVPILGLDGAGRVFLGMILLVIPSGAVCLNRALFGRWSLWPCAGFLLLFGRPLLWGFLNYLFGIGLALHGLALFVALAGRPRQRLVVGVLFGLAVYVSHVEAFALFALALVGLEAGPVLAALRARHWKAASRRAMPAILILSLPLVLFLATWNPQSGAGVKFGNPLRKLDILFSVADAYQRPFDIACFALGLCVLGGLAWWRRLSLAPGMGWALGLVLAFYLVLPAQALSGSAADHRVPIFLFLLLVAGSRPVWPSPRMALAAATIAISVFVIRIGLVEQAWLAADREYATDTAALDTLPAGSRIAVAAPADAVHVERIPLLHLPVLAVARRGAFVTTLFATPGQQPVGLRPPWDDLAKEANPARLWQGLVSDDATVRAGLAPLLGQLDVIAFVSPRPMKLTDITCLSPLFQGARFQLWTVNHAACP
jgi:hypothetical protein